MPEAGSSMRWPPETNPSMPHPEKRGQPEPRGREARGCEARTRVARRVRARDEPPRRSPTARWTHAAVEPWLRCRRPRRSMARHDAEPGRRRWLATPRVTRARRPPVTSWSKGTRGVRSAETTGAPECVPFPRPSACWDPKGAAGAPGALALEAERSSSCSEEHLAGSHETANSSPARRLEARAATGVGVGQKNGFVSGSSAAGLRLVSSSNP